MDTRLFASVFVTVFLAELGDKTQLATMLFAAKGDNPKWTVFVAAASALVATTALGVLGGEAISRAVPAVWLSRGAGVGFVVIGLWTLIKA